MRRREARWLNRRLHRRRITFDVRPQKESLVTPKDRSVVFVTAIFLAIGGCAYWAYQDLQESYTVRTKENAQPKEVTFLHLPPAVSRVAYWRDGANYFAEFNVTEKDFRRMFAKFQFHNITDPITVYPKVFGDPDIFPTDGPHEGLSVFSGLCFRDHWDNGGGYYIIYDRLRSRAYYDFCTH